MRERTLAFLESQKANGIMSVPGVVPLSNEDWYFLHVENAESRAQFLTSILKIPCHTYELRSGQCITFPADYVKQVLEQIGFKDAQYTLKDLNQDHMYEMELMNGGASPVDASSWSFTRPDENFEAWFDLLPVFKEVRDKYGIIIIPDNPHGKSIRPSGDETENVLHVHFFSAAVDSPHMSYTKVFGHGLNGGQGDGFTSVAASQMGMSITDDSGQIVAEVIGNDLYVLFDLPHSGGSHVSMIFTEIMKKYFTAKGKGVTSFERALESLKKTTGLSSKDKFVRDCSALIEVNVTNTERELQLCDAQLEQAQAVFISKSREKEVILAKLKPLIHSKETKKEWAKKEYDSLCATPHVKDIKLDGALIQVFTDMIYVPFNRKEYKVGEFRLDIYVDGTHGLVKAYNLSGVTAGVYHPHIQKTGYCCLGNLSEGVTKLAAEYQYAVLIQLLINYLHSYNPDSAYARIESWSVR